MTNQPKEKEMLYMHLPNGDFNEPVEDLEHIRWELNEGGAQEVIITNKKLDVNVFTGKI